jgi:hypothetical protein
MTYSKPVFFAGGLTLLLVGFILGRMVESSPLDSALSTVSTEVHDVFPVRQQETVSEEDAPQVPLGADSSQTDTMPVLEKAIDIASLTTAQKKMLESFGVDTTALTVTSAMVSCAKEKLGDQRLSEIMKGATPSFIEGATLFSCYTR